jgi:hypothetical protein
MLERQDEYHRVITDWVENFFNHTEQKQYHDFQKKYSELQNWKLDSCAQVVPGLCPENIFPESVKMFLIYYKSHYGKMHLINVGRK